MAAIILFPTHDDKISRGEPPRSLGDQQDVPWAPQLYAFDLEASDAKHRSLAEEAQMLRELGFDGAAYLLWFDRNPSLRQLGEDLDNNLRILDEVGLPLLGVGLVANVDPDAPHPYDPRVVEAMRKLKGRPLTVEVLLQGLPTGDERGRKPAITILRQLGDLARESDLRISVYHHVNSWAGSFVFALRVVKEVNHPNVGLNFNLAHWLLVDGDKDYGVHLRDGAQKIFVVTINGAKVGSSEVNELIQPLDQGDFDNRRLLETLREIGYRGAIGLQCFGIPGDAREHLQRSMIVWKTWKTDWAKDNL